MTFTQLEYIVALNAYRHFAEAAAQCFVTQPTLSMQIQKMEEEIGLKIFNRSKQPVMPTEEGLEIIQQARKILAARNALQEWIDEKKGTMEGCLKIGIIPTIAPYLLPLFLPAFASQHTHIQLLIKEHTTQAIINGLKEGSLDIGILVTPLHEENIKEEVLFYEELVVYVSPSNVLYNKKQITPQQLSSGNIWMLEEGHCFRSQVMNLCDLQASTASHNGVVYEASSLEALRRMADATDGITLLPELAALALPASLQNSIKHFVKPVPVREVSIAMHADFGKKRLMNFIKQSILKNIPPHLLQNKNASVVPVVRKIKSATNS
jgi:LysR family hydrogen peroxide-inducible transcriptional activator